MSHPWTLQSADGKESFPIEFTSLGIARMEEDGGMKLADLLDFVEKAQGAEDPTIEEEERQKIRRQVGFEMGMRGFIAMLFAGLEGYRLKHNVRVEPYTRTEAGEILDKCGGFMAVSAVIAEAFKGYFPNLMGVTLEERQAAAKKRATTGVRKKKRPTKRQRNSSKTAAK